MCTKLDSCLPPIMMKFELYFLCLLEGNSQNQRLTTFLMGCAPGTWCLRKRRDFAGFYAFLDADADSQIAREVLKKAVSYGGNALKNKRPRV